MLSRMLRHLIIPFAACSYIALYALVNAANTNIPNPPLSTVNTANTDRILNFLHSFNLSLSTTDLDQWESSSFSLPCHLARLILPTTETITPSSSNYTTLANSNWVQNAQLQPSCIVLPSTPQELSKLVRIVSFAQPSNSSWAVRSGGHEVESGFSNTQGGMLIDMRGFRELEYDASDASVVIGTGLRWGDVYEYLRPFNVTVAGGRVSIVGVGGFTLGCGLAWHSNKYGLACDNVKNFEIVLANGRVVDANADSHPDLFWALKGGINNFGIVTRFTFQAIPQGLAWGGYVGYTLDQVPSIIDALAQYQSLGQPSDPGSNLIVQIAPSNASFGALLTFFHDTPTPWPYSFSPFAKIQPRAFDLTRIADFASLLADENAADATGIPRFNWRSTSFKADKETMQETYDVAVAVANSTALFEGKTVAWTFQPISVNTVLQGMSRRGGGNALGLSPVPQVWSKTDIGWSSAQDDVVAESISPKLIAEVEARTKANGQYLEYQFMNDASKDQDVLGHYGRGNCERLKRVARVYDPEGLFQTLPGFKLPERC